MQPGKIYYSIHWDVHSEASDHLHMHITCKKRVFIISVESLVYLIKYYIYLLNFPALKLNLFALRKHAHMIYSNFFMSKIDNFQRKIFDIFLIFAQNIDCGYTLEPPRRGGSNEYPQSMFWSKNKKNRYTPAYPCFTI